MNAYGVRGLSEQGLTRPSRWRSGHRHEEWFVVWSHCSPQSSAALPLPGKHSSNRDSRTSRGAHAQTLGSRTAVTRTLLAQGSGTGCARGAACGLALSACSRPGRNVPRSALESTEPLRNSSHVIYSEKLVTEVRLVAQKPGITQPNRLHSSYWEPLETQPLLGK